MYAHRAVKIGSTRKARDRMKIKTEQIFPLILIAIDILAAIVYFAHKDIKKGVYWIAAAVLSVTVTF